MRKRYAISQFCVDTLTTELCIYGAGQCTKLGLLEKVNIEPNI